MSMSVIFIKVLPDFHRRIVESAGELLNAVGHGQEEKGFDRHLDSYEELDYRDIGDWAEDEKHPLYEFFHSDAVLHEDYSWSYGHPTYFAPEAVAALSKRFAEANDDAWQMQDVAEFLSRATQEGKGVIVGID